MPGASTAKKGSIPSKIATIWSQRGAKEDGNLSHRKTHAGFVGTNESHSLIQHKLKTRGSPPQIKPQTSGSSAADAALHLPSSASESGRHGAVTLQDRSALKTKMAPAPQLPRISVPGSRVKQQPADKPRLQADAATQKSDAAQLQKIDPGPHRTQIRQRRADPQREGEQEAAAVERAGTGSKMAPAPLQLRISAPDFIPRRKVAVTATGEQDTRPEIKDRPRGRQADSNEGASCGIKTEGQRHSASRTKENGTQGPK
ncbi:uncharacterized protein LOC143806997 [Ranitomeya variabilis]|uniref:uncharacterized protein LOC143806997 n=1 Tax=Ranitomeya variabilis TaxID=490064 RepID=UPI004056EADE